MRPLSGRQYLSDAQTVQQVKLDHSVASVYGEAMSEQPICYVLIGPPCSGKSTYREQLMLGERKPVIISSDDFIEEYATEHGITYSEAFPLVSMKDIAKNLRARLIAAAMKSADIIIDRTNMTFKSRNKLLSNIPKHYRKVGIVFSVPREVLAERLKARGEATGKWIPAKVVDEMIAVYQEPVAGEFHEIIQIG